MNAINIYAILLNLRSRRHSHRCSEQRMRASLRCSRCTDAVDTRVKNHVHGHRDLQASFRGTHKIKVISKISWTLLVNIYSHFLSVDLRKAKIGISNVFNFKFSPVKRKIRRQIAFEVLGQYNWEHNTIHNAGKVRSVNEGGSQSCQVKKAR